MSPARLTLFTVLCALSGIWAALTLDGQYVRFANRSLLNAIRLHGADIDPKAVASTEASYSRTIALLPCTEILHEERALLRAQLLDQALVNEDLPEADTMLDQTQQALADKLSCSPRDGKAWLDLAVVETNREGITPRALKAYRMSAQVAPGESWLAEKRLLFALSFLPVLDEESRNTARGDIQVLARAHPNRMTRVMNVANVENPVALTELFKKQ